MHSLAGMMKAHAAAGPCMALTAVGMPLGHRQKHMSD